MITVGEVLTFLIPDVEWTIYGQKYEDIVWHNGTAPISKKEFEAGFEQLVNFRAEQEAQAQAKKEAALAKLVALGLDAEDLKALGL